MLAKPTCAERINEYAFLMQKGAADVSVIPTDLIRTTLDHGFRVIQAGRLTPETPTVGLAVERHRWTWRPDDVRVLLIAESHVFTSAEDVMARVQTSALPLAARHTPIEYVRLVYCLGYGETRVLSAVPTGGNRGTPQFWNTFGRIAGTGRQPTTLAATCAQRLAWKVDTLQRLQTKGVWLLDASMHGIYAPGGVRVAATINHSLHRIWLQHYGGWLLQQHPAAYRCAIGSGVAATLRQLGLHLHNWIYQPQARATPTIDLEHGWRELLAAAG